MNEIKGQIILKTSMRYNLGEEMKNNVKDGKKGGVRGGGIRWFMVIGRGRWWAGGCRWWAEIGGGREVVGRW
jgi:hypothetical protein